MGWLVLLRRAAAVERATSPTMTPLHLEAGACMEPAVVASLISSSVALFIAVIGVVANARGQTRATKAATDQALALFDRQAAERAEAQQAEFRSRTALTHLAERRALYVEIQSLMYVRPDLVQQERDYDAALVAAADDPDETMRLLPKHSEALRELMLTTRRVAEALQLVWLVAPHDVARAASAVLSAIGDNDEAAMTATHPSFVVAVRRDLGADERATLPVAGASARSGTQVDRAP